MRQFLCRHAEEALGAVLLAIMAGIAFINVVVRSTTFSFAWTEELTVNLFVWVVLLGTSCVFRDGGHLHMSLLYTHCPGSVRLAFTVLGVLLCLIFFGALAYYGVLEVIDEYQLESISESLGIPVWWYTMATPIFSLLVIVRMLQRAYTDIRQGSL